MSNLVNTDINGILKNIRCFALDMDGTFYLSDRLLDGSLSFIDALKAKGRKFVFLTNNSSKSNAAYEKKLANMGLVVDKNELVTSGEATIDYLKREYDGKKVYLLGNDILKKEFSEAGISLVEDGADILVTAFDTTLDYGKMCKACDIVRCGKPYIATHPDYNCPTDGGFIPDIGAIHAFIHASTGRMPDKIIGKPYRDIIDCALRKTGCKADETAMVGDRMYTDIAVSANVPGLTGILVLTGESSLEDVKTADVKPHLIFERLADMIPML